jgi:AbrB family looped-hinge helix DNA binding protein
MDGHSIVNPIDMGGAHMKATGIVRRIDDLGRVVIPKEIRRTMRIREGDPTLITLTEWERFYITMMSLAGRLGMGVPAGDSAECGRMTCNITRNTSI